MYDITLYVYVTSRIYRESGHVNDNHLRREVIVYYYRNREITPIDIGCREVLKATYYYFNTYRTDEFLFNLYMCCITQ